MQDEVDQEKAEDEWQKKREDTKRKDEEKTEKNRKRRDKRRAAKKNNAGKTGGPEGMAVDAAPEAVTSGPQTDAGAGEEKGQSSIDGVEQSAEVPGVIIHDD